MFDSTMKTMAIPERVFALCQVLKEGAIAEETARKMFEPGTVSGNSPYFGAVETAASQLGLIETNDDSKEVRLAVDKKIVDNMQAMRLYVNGRIESVSDGQFYKTTKTWMLKSDELFKVDKDLQNVSKMVSILNGYDPDLKLDEDSMRAWRFWSSFLGFGYLHEMFFMPNAATYLWDSIKNAGIKAKKIYTISEFFDLLKPFTNICLSDDELSRRKMNFAVSNAMRTLNDLGVIELKYVNDREDEWNLTPMPLHTFASLVTDVEYKGDKIS